MVGETIESWEYRASQLRGKLRDAGDGTATVESENIRRELRELTTKIRIAERERDR